MRLITNNQVTVRLRANAYDYRHFREVAWCPDQYPVRTYSGGARTSDQYNLRNESESIAVPAADALNNGGKGVWLGRDKLGWVFLDRTLTFNQLPRSEYLFVRAEGWTAFYDDAVRWNNNRGYTYYSQYLYQLQRDARVACIATVEALCVAYLARAPTLQNEMHQLSIKREEEMAAARSVHAEMAREKAQAIQKRWIKRNEELAPVRAERARIAAEIASANQDPSHRWEDLHVPECKIFSPEWFRRPVAPDERYDEIDYHYFEPHLDFVLAVKRAKELAAEFKTVVAVSRNRARWGVLISESLVYARDRQALIDEVISKPSYGQTVSDYAYYPHGEENFSSGPTMSDEEWEREQRRYEE